ncbi:MAG: DNA-binding protein [Anaerolineaceae bacterium]|nr:DNA-binding protein [Anaerolineaceae bacterium]
MKLLVFRLHPDQDLKLAIDTFANEHSLTSGFIITCVGNLKKAAILLAGQTETVIYTGKYEILSLSGIYSRDGSHYHIAVADEHGMVFGGHLMEGCQIDTTAEIVMGALPEVTFGREIDNDTGSAELIIRKRYINNVED